MNTSKRGWIFLGAALISNLGGCSFMVQRPAHRAPQGSYPRCSASYASAGLDFAAAGLTGWVTLNAASDGDVGTTAYVFPATLFVSGIYGAVNATRCLMFQDEASQYIPRRPVRFEVPPESPPVAPPPSAPAPPPPPSEPAPPPGEPPP
ncbi:MAG: hypothetical protein SGI86_12805 [Deltaproteobacteria bacterium]|nr:hypothetical protein [Deltaproteobacteria bacterium]